MSEEEENKKPRSVFDGPAEEPEEGANVMDEGGGEFVKAGVEKEETEDGHLKMRVGTGEIDPFDHSNEVEAIKKKKEADGVAPPDMPETQDIPLNNPAMMGNASDRLKEEMEARFQQEFGDLEVEATPADREAFVRAALHDEELILEVTLDGIGATMKIAMPSDEFTNSAAAAVGYWGQEDYIDKDSDLQWLLAFQQIHAWFQVREINGKPTPWSDYWVDGMPPIKEVRKHMRTHGNFEDFFQMNAVKWRMLIDAIRVAEMKYKICLQNWRDRSFFTGADTG